MLFASEAEYQECLASHLAEEGWEVEMELRFQNSKGTYWRLDIHAVKRTVEIIVEAKVSASKYKEAIPQLKRYAPFWPKAQLWFACPDEVSEQGIQSLIANGIQNIPTKAMNLERFIGKPVHQRVKGRVISSAKMWALPSEVREVSHEAIANRICLKCSSVLRGHKFTILREDSFVSSYQVTALCTDSGCREPREVLCHRPKPLMSEVDEEIRRQMIGVPVTIDSFRELLRQQLQQGSPSQMPGALIFSALK